MSNILPRRHFFGGIGAAALTTLAPIPVLGEEQAGSLLPTRGPLRKVDIARNDEKGRFRPFTRLGLGGVAIGNGFAPATDEQCEETLKAAWASGARYFDTSPWYGLGLSERRFGLFLKDQPRDDFVLSTKVGRLFEAASVPPKTHWKDPSPFNYRYDYSGPAVRRSIEDSLQRLGLSRIDIVFVHDLSPDNDDLRDWNQQFEVAKKGAFPELTKMRKEGLIRAWGLGVNRPEPALRALEVSDPDIFLLATQYSLMEHQDALLKTFPALEKRGVSVVVGAPLNAGYLALRERYNYKGTVPPGGAEKRARMERIAAKFGVDLRTVALQFCAAPQIVSAVIPGARTGAQAQANGQSMRVKIPPQLWAEFKKEGHIHESAPVPA